MKDVNQPKGLRETAGEIAAQLDAPRKQSRAAQALAAKGRGGDTAVAHVTPGEFVLPAALQTPEVMQAIAAAAARAGVPLARFQVGARANSINPRTGVAEFDDPAPDERPPLPFDPDKIRIEPDAIDLDRIEDSGPPLPDLRNYGSVGEVLRHPIDNLFHFLSEDDQRRWEEYQRKHGHDPVDPLGRRD